MDFVRAAVPADSRVQVGAGAVLDGTVYEEAGASLGGRGTLVFVPTYAQQSWVLQEVLYAVEAVQCEGGFDVLVVENSTSEAPWEWLRQSRWAEFENWFLVRLAFPGSDDEEFFGNAVKQARVYEFARAFALARGYDKVLLVEHDVVVPPSVLQRLDRHDLPVVLGTYRMPPDHHIVAGRFDGSAVPYRQQPGMHYGTTMLTEKDIAARGLVRVDVGGVGCALIRRDVLKRVGWRAYADTTHHCDVYFAVDCMRLGIPIHLDAGVRPIHLRMLTSIEEHWAIDNGMGERMYEPYYAPRDHVARYEWALRFVPERGSVIDVGCGSGYGSSRLAAKASVVGIEVDFSPYLYAKRHYGNVDFVNDDWFDWSSGAEHFADTIVSFENVEHVREGFAYVAKAWRLLKHGGRFVVSTPRRGTSGSPYHLREYSYAGFLAMLGTHFDVVEEAWQDSKDGGEVHVGRNEAAETFIFVCQPKPASEVQRPLVSIFIGCRMKNPHDEAYLAEAVRSALDQTYPWLEVVLVHNGPVPKLPGDPRLHVVPQSRHASPWEKDMNIGAAEALGLTTGDYVLRLDHDNAYYPTTVEDRVIFMLEHPDVDMAYTDATVINDAGQPVGSWNPSEYDYELLLRGNYIDGNAAIIKGPLWRALSFDPAAWQEDWDCWLRLGQKHRITKMQADTFHYRRHDGNMTRLSSAEITASVEATKAKALAALGRTS